MSPPPQDHSFDSSSAVDELLLECLERIEEERAAALEEICAAHPGEAEAIRRRFRLLQEMGLVESDLDSVPMEFGDFRLIRRIGAGGMGVVYLAEQQSLRRQVALKLIQPGRLYLEHARQRFQREALAASRLNHPGICPIYEVGEVRGIPFLAMCYLEGVTLAQRIDHVATGSKNGASSEGSTSAGALGELLGQFETLARALHMAHEVGLVHRDVKPANIMLTDSGDPVLVDFGLARDSSGELADLTRTKEILGTPKYMAPEQITGAGDVDRRCDVYGLGATLYEALTLRAPYEAPSYEALYHAILTGKLLPPSHFNKRIAGDLDVILETALDRDPARRYQTSLEFAEDLGRVRRFEPIQARPTPVLLRLKRWAQRHPVAATSLAGAVLLVTVCLAFLTRDLQQTHAHARRLGRELTRSRALNLAAASAGELEGEPAAGLSLALRAVELDRNPETLSQVLAALAAQFEIARFGPDVVEADISPVNRMVLTHHRDGSVRLWDLEGRELTEIHTDGRATRALFASDEEEILITVRLAPERLAFRAHGTDGALLTEVESAGEQSLRHGRWSPDGSRIVARRSDGTVVLLTGAGEPIRQLAASADGRLGFSPGSVPFCVNSENLTIWPEGADALELSAPPAAAFTMRSTSPAFDPGGESIATIHDDKVVRLWNWSGELLVKLAGHDDRVNSVEFSRTGDTLLTGSRDATARLWSRAGDTLAIANHGTSLWRARFFGGERRFLTISWWRAFLWDGSGNRLAQVAGDFGSTNPLSDVAAEEGLFITRERGNAVLMRMSGAAGLFLRSGHERGWARTACTSAGEIVAATLDGKIVVWGPEGRVQRVLDSGGSDPLFGVAVSPDRSLVAAGGGRGRILVMDFDSAEIRWETVIGDGESFSLAFSPSGDRLRIARYLRQTILVDVASWTHEKFEDTRAFAFSPDAEWLALGRGENVSLRDRQGEEVLVFRAHDEWLSHLAFHPDGRRLASASVDGTVKIWDLDAVRENAADAAPTVTIRHQAVPWHVEFSPDGERFLTTTTKTLIRNLDGVEQFRLPPTAGDSRAVGVTFSPDGRWLVGMTRDGAVRWPAREEDFLRIAREWGERLASDLDLSEYAHLLKAE